MLFPLSARFALQEELCGLTSRRNTSLSSSVVKLTYIPSSTHKATNGFLLRIQGRPLLSLSHKGRNKKSGERREGEVGEMGEGGLCGNWEVVVDWEVESGYRGSKARKRYGPWLIC